LFSLSLLPLPLPLPLLEWRGLGGCLYVGAVVKKEHAHTKVSLRLVLAEAEAEAVGSRRCGAWMDVSRPVFRLE
jgi:hypothetical protein